MTMFQGEGGVMGLLSLKHLALIAVVLLGVLWKVGAQQNMYGTAELNAKCVANATPTAPTSPADVCIHKWMMCNGTACVCLPGTRPDPDSNTLVHCLNATNPLNRTGLKTTYAGSDRLSLNGGGCLVPILISIGGLLPFG